MFFFFFSFFVTRFCCVCFALERVSYKNASKGFPRLLGWGPGWFGAVSGWFQQIFGLFGDTTRAYFLP